MTTFIILSVISCGLSIMACTWSLIVTVRLNRLQAAIHRVSSIEETVVRSVMEEGGHASVEAVLQTAERIAKIGKGMAAQTAYEYAIALHKRQA